MPIGKISGLSQFLTCKCIFNKIPQNKIIFLVITKAGRKYTKMLIVITSWWQKWQASFFISAYTSLHYSSLPQSVIGINTKKLKMKLFNYQINCSYMLWILGTCEICSFSYQGIYILSVPLTLDAQVSVPSPSLTYTHIWYNLHHLSLGQLQ